MIKAYALIALFSTIIAPTTTFADKSFHQTTLKGVQEYQELCASIIKNNTVKNPYITAPPEVHLTASELKLCN